MFKASKNQTHCRTSQVQLAESAEKLARGKKSFTALCNLMFARSVEYADPSAEENLHAAESRVKELDLPQNYLTS